MISKSMIKIILCFLCLSLGLVIHAQDQNPCAGGTCQELLGQGAYVHTPTKDNHCADCHEIEVQGGKISKSDFTLKKIVVKNGCLSCHSDWQKYNMHGKDSAKFYCESCHDSHKSYSKALLRKTVMDKCVKCHAADVMKGEFKHRPAKNKSCLTCHPYHRINTTPVKAVDATFCFKCHGELKTHADKAVSVHPPFLKNCTSCHDIHSAKRHFQLKETAPELCKGCHTDHFNKINASKISHGALRRGESCLNCHNPHYSKEHKLLRNVVRELCFKCHNTSFRSSRGHMITNMKKLLHSSKFVHSPAEKGQCQICHNTHGGDNSHLLKKAFPEANYSAYSRDEYMLCFACHNPAKFEEKNDIKDTNFNDGTKSLHFVHVNNATKGRSCKNCHEIHASDNRFFIRDTVDFGTSSIKLNFVEFEDGGQCGTACHNERRYNNGKRKNIPIAWPTQVKNEKK